MRTLMMVSMVLLRGFDSVAAMVESIDGSAPNSSGTVLLILFGVLALLIGAGGRKK